MGRLALVPAAYVFLEREDGKYLFMLRARTGYQDGNYQVPSGHIEENETPREGAVREAKEEVGVDIDPNDLEFVHAMYRMNVERTGYRIDLSFKTKKWKGEPFNAETDKCDGVEWFSPDELPQNTVGFMHGILNDMKKGEKFAELVF